MRISHSTLGRREGEQWRWASVAALTSSSLVQPNEIEYYE
jgi:hypothetical protein